MGLTRYNNRMSGSYFETVAKMEAAKNLTPGQIVTVGAGSFGQAEGYTYLASSTLTADGALIVDAVGMGVGRLVSQRREYADFAEFIGDRRTFTAGTTLTISSIGAVYEATDTDGNLVKPNAGAQEFDVISQIPYVEHFGAVGDYDGVSSGTDSTAEIQAALDYGMSAGVRVGFAGSYYLISDTIDLLNENSVLSFGFYGQSGNSTRIYFDNATPLKNMFKIGSNVTYLEISDIEFADKAARTSRAFYFSDTLVGGLASWKHLFRNIRITQFKEGVYFDGGATIAEDAALDSVMFLHSKLIECETGLIYDNIQAVSHHLIGMDFENSSEGASDEWTHIKLLRGTTINHIGGSVIGKGSYLEYIYPSASGSFQNTSQFLSKGVRVEKRGGVSPLISHNTSSVLTVSNSLRIIIEDMPVQASLTDADTFARIGGQSYLELKNVHANKQMNVEAVVTTNLNNNRLFGAIEMKNCKAINYVRVSDLAAYGSAAPSATVTGAIPARLTAFGEATNGAADGDGYFTFSHKDEKIYCGSWDLSQPRTMVVSETSTGGLGPGSNPATFLAKIPNQARPFKFRAIREGSVRTSPFVLSLYFVVSGVDYLVAEITPTSGEGGHFEADIRAGAEMQTFLNDGTIWDGKIKIVKSGTLTGFRGFIMIDYM